MEKSNTKWKWVPLIARNMNQAVSAGVQGPNAQQAKHPMLPKHSPQDTPRDAVECLFKIHKNPENFWKGHNIDFYRHSIIIISFFKLLLLLVDSTKIALDEKFLNFCLTGITCTLTRTHYLKLCPCYTSSIVKIYKYVWQMIMKSILSLKICISALISICTSRKCA